MKKIILSVLILSGSLPFISAQENTLGLKIGYGIDLSYQRVLTYDNRLEIDLGLSGFNFDDPRLYVSGLYHWVWDLSQLAPGFTWYAGPGAGIGIYDDSFSLRALGQVGIEYNFDFPLQLTLDWTPSLMIIPDVKFGFEGFALGVRYKF